MNRLSKIIEGFKTIRKGSEWEKVFRKAQEWRGDSLSLDEPYKQSIWVHIAVNKIAVNVAQAPLVWYKDEQPLDDAPVTKLFEYVNPYLSHFQLWEATTGYLMLQGNCIWLFDKSRGQAAGISGSLPSAIYPVSITNFKYVTDDKGRLTGWVYQAKGQQIPLKPEDVIHFALWNPYDPYLGLSPYEAVKLSAESDYQAQKFNRNLFKNSATPSGVLSFDKSLSEAQYERLLKAWEARHQGSDKAHKVALLEGGAKWSSIILTPRETEFNRGRAMNREEILGAYGVPKFVAGLSEDFSYSNAMAAKKLFWNDTILPILKLYEDKLETDFTDRYLQGQDIEAHFDLTQVTELQEDMKDRVDIAQILYNIGFTRNEINERLDLGFQDAEWGDEPKPTGGGFPQFNQEEFPTKDFGTEKKPTKGKKLPLNTIEERVTKWNQLNQYMLPFENRIRNDAKKLFGEMKEQTINRVKQNWVKRDFNGWSANKIRETIEKQGVDDLVFELDLYKSKWNSKLRSDLTSAVNESGSRALEMVSLDIAFDVSDPRIVSWINKRALEHARSIIGTSKEEVRSILREAYVDGDNLATVTNKLEHYFDAPYKSERIARTEISFAQNYGASEAYRQSEVVESKEFLASPDSCDDCKDYDGDEFDLGADIIPLHPNCRCTWIPIVKSEEI